MLPHLAAALVAAIGVAVISASLGRSWAVSDVYRRIVEIERTLNDSTVPLTPAVLNSVADLTGTELITFEQKREISQSTIELSIEERSRLSEILETYWSVVRSTSSPLSPINIGGRAFLAFPFERRENLVGRDRVRHVLVLADADGVDAAGKRAASLPLATGFSCIILLSTITIAISNHLAKRLITLQQSVQRVAGGDFELSVADSSNDEVGQLGRAVDTMAAQLKKLWSQVNRQQGERLLHQIAGGMAHQLRNTLTGARMAMELHAERLKRRSEGVHGDEIDVALRELDVAEDYVRRLLLVSAGTSQKEKPDLVAKCLRDVYSAHEAVAKHLRVDFKWQGGEKGTSGLMREIAGVPLEKIFDQLFWVADGVAFSAAISNLVLNAMQAADEVILGCEVVSTQNAKDDRSSEKEIVVSIEDNGAGIDPSVECELFEPFVTSKPEGMGLGLALVRRSAEQLGGDVVWRREAGRTIFTFRCPVFEMSPNA